MITALKTSLRSVTLNTDFAGVTATKPVITQPTAPTLSERQLRTLLDASRASGDPVTAGATDPVIQADAPSLPSPSILPVNKLLDLVNSIVGGPIDWQKAAEKWKASQKQ